MENFDAATWGWGFFGIGLTLVLGLLPFAIRKLPRKISAIGFLFGAVNICLGLMFLAIALFRHSPPAQPTTEKVVPTDKAAPSERTPPSEKAAPKSVEIPGPTASPKISVPPEIPPRPETVIKSKMAWGTMAPNGIPTIAYAIVNVGTGSLKDVYASVWLQQPNGGTKLDGRQFEYIAPGESRQAAATVESTPYGRGLLCVSFERDGKRMYVLNFYESDGEYARYGPMREMRTAKDPMSAVDNADVCRSRVQQIAGGWR